MLDLQKIREGKYKEDRIGYALRGENPTQLARLESGFAFLMDVQLLPGWCVLTAYPQVFELNSLTFEMRNLFLMEMQVLGEAIAEVVQPVRMNYSIYGNTDHYLHAHVYPRYAWETPERLRGPAWSYPPEAWQAEENQVNEGHIVLGEKIAERLALLMEEYRG